MRGNGRTVAIDFDGVIHPYTAGWVGETPADEPPIPGARELCEDLLAADFKLVCHSARARDLAGLNGILAYLSKYKMLTMFVKVTHEKPMAVAYVDDRAVPYTGSWSAVRLGIARLAEEHNRRSDRVAEQPLAWHAPPLDVPDIVHGF